MLEKKIYIKKKDVSDFGGIETVLFVLAIALLWS